ncbi:MAG: hypothetical protein GSR82_05775 [Desulfurococcales archaeon]|nr:hypothetical protein [Desulfurococcales archaeon]
MSVGWLVLWWKHKKLKEREKELEEELQEARGRMTPEEFLQLKSETLLQRQYDELVGQADAAVQELKEMKRQIEDPAIKAMIEEIEDHWEVMRPDNEVAPGYAVAALALRDALKKGLHKTPEGREKLYQYMIKTAYEVAKAAAHSIPPYHYIDHNMETLTNPLRIVDDTRIIIEYAANRGDKIAKKYRDAIFEAESHVWKKVNESTGIDILDNHGKGERILAHKHHNLIERLLEEKIKEYEEKGVIPRFWHLSAGYILEHSGSKSSAGNGSSLKGPLSGIYGLLEGWDIDAQEVKDELRRIAG